MKRFVLITVGFREPTPEIMDAWSRWFGSLGDRIVEQVGLMNGFEVTAAGARALPVDESALTGYLVIEAQDMDEALSMARECPMITSTSVYEVRTGG